MNRIKSSSGLVIALCVIACVGFYGYWKETRVTIVREQVFLNEKDNSTYLTTAEAHSYIAQLAIVTGTVGGGRYASSSAGRPTLLDLDGTYPHEAFTIVIWGENRPKFGQPERDLIGKKISVTGRIQPYQGKREMALSSPGEIIFQ